ncbi:MAG: hypothetical protein QOJ04_3909 [Caballeronia sp.]|jgi:DNA-binding transcriptional LysR family regulator|nr:hypothetical protein [Caballeronia sp.]
MDRFKQIETFAAVVAKGSLSAAALAEGVAPAVIGRRLDALEERLGVKLLDAFAAPPIGIHSVFPQRRHLPLRVRLFLDLLKHTFGAPGYWG